MANKEQVEKELKEANQMFDSFVVYSNKLKKKYNNKVSFHPKIGDDGIELLIACDLALFHNYPQNPLSKKMDWLKCKILSFLNLFSRTTRRNSIRMRIHCRRQ